jgi:hypothetical protein
MFFNPLATGIYQQNNLFYNCENVYLTTGAAADIEEANTAINSTINWNWPCTGAGDSCQDVPTHAVVSASVTNGVADVKTNGNHGLSVGTPVLVQETSLNNASPAAPCGIDTNYPYPTVTAVISPTEFQYSVNVANSTCAPGGYGDVAGVTTTMPFGSPALKLFILSSDTADPHLNDGNSLAAVCSTFLVTCAVDPNGTTRGSDGAPWDRGAFQVVAPH